MTLRLHVSLVLLLASGATMATPVTDIPADAAVETEDEHGVSGPGVFAYNPIAACLTDLACIGCNVLDQNIFGGRFSAVYQLLLSYAAVGTLIGGILGAVAGLLPGALLANAAYTATLSTSGPEEAFTQSIGTFCTVIGLCAGGGAIALALLGGAIGSIHAFVLWLTDELPGTRPGAWERGNRRGRRAAIVSPPARPQSQPIAY